MHRWRSRGAVQLPQIKNLGALLPPPPSSPRFGAEDVAKNQQNTQSRDHFTNLFISIALGEVIYCKPFLNSSDLYSRSLSTAAIIRETRQRVEEIRHDLILSVGTRSNAKLKDFKTQPPTVVFQSPHQFENFTERIEVIIH